MTIWPALVFFETTVEGFGAVQVDGSGDGALDENQVFVFLDLDDVKIAAGDLFDAPVTGHFLAGIDALGDRMLAAQGAGGAFAVGLAVGGGEAVEAPAPDDAHEAAALGGADDVDLLVALEDADVELGADFDFFLPVPGDFAEDFGGRFGFLELPIESFLALLGLEVALGDDMAHFGAGDVLAAAGAEADLDGVVAVLGLGLDLGHGAGAGLDDGDGEALTFFVVDLGHAEFAAEEAGDHGRISLIEPGPGVPGAGVKTGRGLS